MAGLIFTLDIATRTGWAKGRSGEAPTSGVKDLKTSGEVSNLGKMGNNLCAFLLKEWDKDLPMILVVEQLMKLGGFAMNANSEANVKMQISLHMAARMAADVAGVRFAEAHASTVSKHFIGKGNLKRAEKKPLFVKRCQLLRYMGSEDYDDNQADALAVWDYATAHYSGKIPTELHLFGEVKK